MGGAPKAMSGRKLPIAGALILAGWAAPAFADDFTFMPTGDAGTSAKVELIDSSRLGCGSGGSAFSTAGSNGQCAFDTATHGAKISASYIGDTSAIEAYGTVARATSGAFTPDSLLTNSRNRATEATDFMMLGMKASALNNRLKMSAEIARTQQVVEQLRDQDLALADWGRQDGTSASVKVDAILADSRNLKWSMAAQYNSVSDGFSVGRSDALMLYSAIPGTRLSLSTKARFGQYVLSAGLEQTHATFGSSGSRRLGFDMDGVSMRLVSRDTETGAIAGTTSLGSAAHSTGAYVDIDGEMLASNLFPNVMKLPAVVPSMLSFSYKTGETENHYDGLNQLYRKSSIGIDGSWSTPLGRTDLSYWRDKRDGLTDGTRSSTSETYEISHFIQRGNWRFGLDASLYRTRGEGSIGYNDSSLSFGQSIAYSVENGPEFSLHLGQDRGQTRKLDDTYFSSDRYSTITASLDLTKYLQKRFGRPDLHLTLDYRKAIESTDETDIYEAMVERWIDGSRRQGFLMSFGMNL